MAYLKLKVKQYNHNWDLLFYFCELVYELTENQLAT